jgi:hypothetical protein
MRISGFSDWSSSTEREIDRLAGLGLVDAPADDLPIRWIETYRRG